MRTRTVVLSLALCLLLSLCLLLRPGGEREAPAPEQGFPAGVVRLIGSPAEIGRAHGTALRREIRIMLDEYVRDEIEDGRRGRSLMARVRGMKPHLPDWYRRELAACAEAAGVDEDLLLYAQCEGDITSLPPARLDGDPVVGGARAGHWLCTSYCAFGEATASGIVEIGRNFDYWGLESTDRCAKIFAYIPREGDGYRFISVGWAGILGGWTFYNEKGIFVACDLGGFHETNPEGIPALVLLRTIAQRAGSLAEAIEIIEATPRMRGAALVVGDANAPAAAVVEFDAERVVVTEAIDGLALHSSVGTSRQGLLEILAEPMRDPQAAVYWAGNTITLHSVVIRPAERAIWVAHGRPSSAHHGRYVRYRIEELIRR